MNSDFSSEPLFAAEALGPGMTREELDRIFSLAYEELRRMANVIRRNDAVAALTPTTIVHEAWIKLAASHSFTLVSELHFKRIAARAMRQILIEAARRRQSQKRDGAMVSLLEADAVDVPMVSASEVLSIHNALNILEEVSPRQGAIVELRFFGGLSVAETARLLAVSEETVHREWRGAKAWLRQQLKVA